MLTSLTAASAARADVTSPDYDASQCRASFFDQVDRWEKNEGAKTIKNKSAVTSTLYCPIKKLASAPGRFDDYIKTVSMPFTFAQAGLVDCTVQTWRTGINYGEGNVDNLLTPWFGSLLNQSTPTTTKQTMTITGGPSTLAGYWDGTSASFGKASWYYSMVKCSIPPGATVWPYKVIEAGTNRGYTIDPMISCPLTTDMHWRVTENDSNVHGPSGFVMAQAFGSLQKFYFTCPVTNTQFVQLALGHATGNNISGCSLDSTNMATPTWPAYNGSDWPTDVLGLPYGPSLYVPSTGAHKLYCGQTGTLGDSKWMSIRTTPNATRVGKWNVTASNNAGQANQAIDNKGDTRWATNTRGLKNMWYQVDFGATNIPVVTNVILDSGTSTNDYARKFTVMFSNNGTNWSEMPQSTGTGPVTSVTFSEQAQRYLRIRLDQDLPGTNYWSIHELQLVRNNGM